MPKMARFWKSGRVRTSTRRPRRRAASSSRPATRTPATIQSRMASVARMLSVRSVSRSAPFSSNEVGSRWRVTSARPAIRIDSRTGRRRVSSSRSSSWLLLRLTSRASTRPSSQSTSATATSVAARIAAPTTNQPSAPRAGPSSSPPPAPTLPQAGSGEGSTLRSLQSPAAGRRRGREPAPRPGRTESSRDGKDESSKTASGPTAPAGDRSFPSTGCLLPCFRSS